MSEMQCPNCGRHLVNYRTDRQSAGNREVELHWTICEACRHVALDSWSFADGVIPVERLEDGRAEKKKRSYQSSRPRRRA